MMRKDKILGFATDAGSRTSHTAILARSLGIPAAVGLERITGAVKTGDVVIVDGIHGVVIVDPDEETFLEYLKKQRRYKYFEQELEKLRLLPAVTLDGDVVHLEGNIELPEEVASVAEHGGTGIGLYRTEFLFLNRPDLPTEEQHYQACRHVAERASPQEVVIRTLDVGGDKIGFGGVSEKEANPRPRAAGDPLSASEEGCLQGPAPGHPEGQCPRQRKNSFSHDLRPCRAA